MDGILRFYLDSVLPRALATVTAETRNLKPHVESIQQIFDQLKIEVTNCVSTPLFPVRNAVQRASTMTAALTQMEFLCSVPDVHRGNRAWATFNASIFGRRLFRGPRDPN